jgi:hypothetical protein
MRPGLLCLPAAATLGVAIIVVAARGEEKAAPPERQYLEAPLTFRPYQSAQEMMERSGPMGIWLDQRRTLTGYTLPKVPGKPMLFQTHFMANPKPVVGLLARSTATASAHDRLWFDWNGDRKFTDDERLNGKKSGKLMVFGPLRQPGSKPNGRPAVCIALDSSYGGQIAFACSPGRYEGELQIDGKPLKIALVDANGNGKFDTDNEGDAMWVDRNGNGQLEGAANTWGMAEEESEAVPFSRLLRMPSGFYRLQVADDASRLTVEPDTRPLGRLTAPAARFSLALMGEHGPIRVASTGREASLPEGTYQFQWVHLTIPEAPDKEWKALVAGWHKPVSLKVSPDAPAEIPCGPPFRLGLKISGQGRQRMFSLELRDRAGNDVQDIQQPGGGRPPEPVLKITNSSGKTVKAEKFHYG